MLRVVRVVRLVMLLAHLTVTVTVTVALGAPAGEQVYSPESPSSSLDRCARCARCANSPPGEGEPGGGAPPPELLGELQPAAVQGEVQGRAPDIPAGGQVGR